MAIEKGVPPQAAIDFILGRLNIELAIAFDLQPGGKFSDGPLKVIADAKPVIFQNGWLERVFDPEAVMASVRAICEALRLANDAALGAGIALCVLSFSPHLVR